VRFKYSDIKKIKKHMVKVYDIKTRYRTKLIKDCSTVSVDDADGGITYAFACMHNKYRKIILPIGDRFDGMMVSNIYGSYAHEYAHAYQYDHNLPICEIEADEIANQVLKECLGITVEIFKE